MSARDPDREQAERGGEHLNPPAARAASSAWRRAARGAAPKCAQDKRPPGYSPVRGCCSFNVRWVEFDPLDWGGTSAAPAARDRGGARLVYPHWTQYDHLRPCAAPVDRCSARTAPAAPDPMPASWPCEGGGAPSARPLLRCRSDYASNPPQLHLSSRRVGAMGSARAGQLRGGANCRNHCEAARALSPSPEPMPAAAPEKLRRSVQHAVAASAMKKKSCKPTPSTTALFACSSQVPTRHRARCHPHVHSSLLSVVN